MFHKSTLIPFLRAGRVPGIARGFTLIEMAIVLLIITLLLSALLVPLGTQVEQRKIAETQKTLEEIKEALFGFAIANGRLPCPASAASGVESPTGGVCDPWNGFVPAITLSISPTDNQGFAIDGWGQRIRYAVTTSNTSAVTTGDGIRSLSLGMGEFSPDLHVCASSTGVTAGACGPVVNTNTLTASAPAVIYSLGTNWATGGTGADEAENLDADKVFISHVPSSATAPNGEFDDIVVWLSPNILFSRMLAAGKLP